MLFQKNTLLFFLLLLTLMGCAMTETHSSRPNNHLLLEQKNAAAGFAGTLNFFIGRVAKNCKSILGQNDAFMNYLVKTWRKSNGKFADAALLWTTAGVRVIEEQQGTNAAAHAARKINSVISTNGDHMANELLSGNLNQKKAVCRNFNNEIKSGKYDITPQSEHYHHLNEIIGMLNR